MSNMEFAKRMDRFGAGIFSKLAEIKKEKTAKGEEVIDLSIGAPNIPPAPHIMEALCRAAAEPSNYVYAISDRRELLEAVRGWYNIRYGVELDSETEICSLLGSQEGLAHIALSIVDEGGRGACARPLLSCIWRWTSDCRRQTSLHAPEKGKWVYHPPGRDT